MKKRIRYRLSVFLTLLFVLTFSLPVFAVEHPKYVSTDVNDGKHNGVKIAVSYDNMNKDFSELGEDEYVCIKYSNQDGGVAAWNDLINSGSSAVEDYKINEQSFKAQYMSIWQDYVDALFAAGETGEAGIGATAGNSEYFRQFLIGKITRGEYDIGEVDTTGGDQGKTSDDAGNTDWILPLEVLSDYSARNVAGRATGISIVICQQFGIGILLVGMMQLFLSMKDDNAEAKVRAMKSMYAGILLTFIYVTMNFLIVKA